MEEIKLDVFIRSEKGKRPARRIRREHFVPAIVYGGEAKDPTMIKVDGKTFERAMRSNRGQSVVFHLNVKEGDKALRDYSAILKEEQLDPVSDELIHIDFMRISLKEEIEAKTPIEAKGEEEAPGIKLGGILDQPMYELDIICLPTNIPANISVDVSALNIGDAVHVRDLIMPTGVKTKHDPDAIVFSIVPPTREEEEVVEEAEPLEPEVINEKKKDADSPEESAS